MRNVEDEDEDDWKKGDLEMSRKTRGTMPKTLRVLALAAVVAAVALASSGEAVAEEQGVIYVYLHDSVDGGGVFKMNPDGSGLTLLFPGGENAEPSRESHGGRWFLEERRVNGHDEIFAIHESGEPAVQLTDDASLNAMGFVRWLPGDSAVSWKARRWEDTDGDGVLDAIAKLPDGRYDMGIYVLDIDFSTGRPVPVGPPSLLDWTASLPHDDWGTPGIPYTMLMGYDWLRSADSGEDTIVYELRPPIYDPDDLWFVPGLYVADAQTGNARFLASEAYVPRWSPSGEKIAFYDVATIATTGHSSVGVINADGTGRTTVAAGNGAVSGDAHWSPDGGHLAYGIAKSGGRKPQCSIYRVALDGSANTKLVGPCGATSKPLGWRSAEAAPPPPGITVQPTSGLVTTEAGGADTFTIVLDTQPTADVTIGLSSSDTSEGTVSPTTVTFTITNWDQPQTVMVIGQDDAELDGDVAYTVVTAPAVSGDPSYNGRDADDVSCVNLDDEAPPEPTEVFVTDISYATAGRKGRDLLITVALCDDLGQPVAGASVAIDVALDGQSYDSKTGSTGGEGTVTFKLSKAPSGTYTTSVTGVTAGGLIWDEGTPPNSFTK